MALNWDECEQRGKKASSAQSLEEYRRRKEIVFDENGKKYKGINDARIRFFTFQVDGGILEKDGY